MLFPKEETVNTTNIIRAFILLAVAKLSRDPDAPTEPTVTSVFNLVSGFIDNDSRSLKMDNIHEHLYPLTQTGLINFTDGSPTITERGLNSLRMGPLRDIFETMVSVGFRVQGGHIVHIDTDQEATTPLVASVVGDSGASATADSTRTVTFEEVTIRKVWVCYGDFMGDGSTRSRTAPCTTPEAAAREAREDMMNNHYLAERHAIVFGNKVIIIDSPVERELVPEPLIE